MALKNLIPWKWGGKTVPVKREDVHPFYALQSEMNRLMDDFFGDFSLSPFRGFEDRFGAYTPSIDVTENDKEILVTAELPGMDENDFEVHLSKEALTIKGEKKEEREEKGKDAYRLERSYGAFHRTIPLLCDVDEDKVQATFKKGVLKLKLPKTAEAQKASRKIPVSAA